MTQLVLGRFLSNLFTKSAISFSSCITILTTLANEKKNQIVLVKILVKRFLYASVSKSLTDTDSGQIFTTP